MLRVVFAEDNYLVREGTVALLSGVDDVEVVGTAEAYDELIVAVETHAPDAVLTDIRMPPTGTDEGIRAAKAIRAEHPDVGVVVLSQFADEEYAYDLLKDGAEGLGYLLKERVIDGAVLVDALQRVIEGETVVDPLIVSRLLSRKRKQDPLATLSPREREVLGLVAEGLSNRAIANRLFLTDRTVESHMTSIFGKLGLEGSPDQHRRVLAVLTLLRA